MTITKQPDKEVHLMIDIETLGVQVTTAIFSVAAVTFDIDTGEIFNEFYELIDPSYADNNSAFSHSASTVQWWCDQSAEATAQLIKAVDEGDDWMSVFMRLKTFIHESNAVAYWAKGQFDLPIISYHISCQPFIFKALDFRKFRDLRTTLSEAEINPKNYPNVGASHNALDDCKHRIICLVDAWKRVRAWKPLVCIEK